jgi:hypothetical protein
MAHYSFLKDLKDSQIAVSLIANQLRSKGFTVEEMIGKSKQKLGDLVVVETGVHHEIKFDIMAATTNNLCFEIANGKGELTGIAKTQAPVVHYVVPGKDRKEFLVFTFDTLKLRSYLYDEANAKKIRQVQGGDRRKYTMLIVAIDTIVNDKVANKVEVLSA